MDERGRNIICERTLPSLLVEREDSCETMRARGSTQKSQYSQEEKQSGIQITCKKSCTPELHCSFLKEMIANNNEF